MSAARPPHVPIAAWFAEEERAWVVGERDSSGRPTGLHKRYRADGTPWFLGSYRGGEPHGPFARFHPNGELARVGEFVDGRLHGTVEAFVSESPTNEGLRVCCVPPGAYRVEAQYVDDSPVEERFFDREGHRLLSDGSIYPTRPDAVPASAPFDEGARCWTNGAYTEQGEREGSWRRWSESGVLREERHYASGKLHGETRLYDPEGLLIERATYAFGAYHGPFFRRVPEGTYRDARIRAMEGAYAEGRAVSVWRYLDERGGEVERRGFAPMPCELAASPALATMRSAPLAFRVVAAQLRAEDRAAEAVLAAAREAASSGDRSVLDDELTRATPPLAPSAAHELAATVIASNDADLRTAADALQRGGDTASLLRHLASTLVPVSRAARDLVDAALLLAPERRELYISRALVNLALGAPDAADADVQQLEASALEARQFLTDYRRVLYPTFDFWPRGASFDSQLPGIPDGPQHPLATVQTTVRKYATRLSLIREALLVLTNGATPEWMPPNVDALLPEGRCALQQRRIWVPCETDDDAPPDAPAGAPVEVVIDETLDLSGRDVAALMRLARTEWNGVTWCCYAAGLSEVAMPQTIAPPADFAKAVGMAAERHWRARDRLSTAGLRAMSRGVPGFTWEELDIDTMSPFFAEMVAHEYTELRALLVFLCDEQAESPWQDDLRRD